MVTTMGDNINWAENLPDDQLYSFDDIEKYTYVRLRGDEGFVVDKGDHIMPTMDARHLQVEIYNDNSGSSYREKQNVHEKLVNKFLYENKNLWVDWTGRLGPHVDTGSMDFPAPQPVTD